MKGENQLAVIPAASKADVREDASTLVERGRRTALASSSAKNAADAGPGALNVVKIVHSRLRGRYPLAVALGIVFGGLSAVAAQRLYHPLYKSAGLVRIAYSKPVVMKETDQNRPLANYQTFMQSQKTVVSSRRIIGMAMQDPIWTATGRHPPEDPDRYFTQHLLVEVKPNTELVEISMTDTDPGTASTAVTAVINSYAEYYSQQEKDAEHERNGALQQREDALTSTIEGLTKQIQAGSHEYGTVDLDIFYTAAATNYNKMKASLEEVRAEIAMTPANLAGSAKAGPATQPTTRPDPVQPASAAMSMEQIAAVDQIMLEYFKELTRCQDELVRLQQLGYGSKFKNVVIAQERLDAAQARAERYASAYRAIHIAAQNDSRGTGQGPAAAGGSSPEMLHAKEANFIKLLDEAKQDMKEIGDKQLALKHEQEELLKAQDELAKLKTRMDDLQSENSLGSRFTIISSGDTPLSPDKDFRIPVEAASGLVGACMPAGVMLLLLAKKRRYRYADDAESDSGPIGSKVPLLGILPELPAEGAQDERLQSAAHSIHEIRLSLRSQGATASCRSYLITSATPGEGKTSVTLALGLSFAASRLRTLVIDGDLVGRNLTRTLNAKENEGFYEATLAGSLRQLVRKTETGLYILTAGKPAAGKPCTVSPAGVKSLLAEARRYFDVVLIDTGPILGSLESQVLAQEVDDVIFVISRDQERQFVERAMGRLTYLGASIAGCVFNRAKLSDFDRSSSFGSSNRSLSHDLPGPEGAKIGDQWFSRFGPLVKAVAYGMPAVSPRKQATAPRE